MDSQELLEIDKVAVSIMIVGGAQVGKTSIINRYIGNNFQEKYDPYKDFYEKTIKDKNKEIKLYLTD